MRVVCISDTHGDHQQVELPDGDVLVHAGDLTAHGSRDDLQRFLDWFSEQPFEHRVFIAGNHDAFLENEPVQTQEMVDAAGVTYLNDTGVHLNGIGFWGSPITPRFHEWSFMRNPGDEIEQHWRMIPSDTKVLVTHGPPWGILDVIQRSETVFEHTGCESLRARVSDLKPDYHLFGHIHEGFGRFEQDGVNYMNISTMNNQYQIINTPVVIDL